MAVVVVGEVDAGGRETLGYRGQLAGKSCRPAHLEVLPGQTADRRVPAPPHLMDLDQMTEIAAELVPAEVGRRDLQSVVGGHARHLLRRDGAEGGHLHGSVSHFCHLAQRLRHILRRLRVLAHGV